MKRLIVIILAALLAALTALSFSACSAKDKDGQVSETPAHPAASEYPGTWYDYFSKRAAMEIRPQGDVCEIDLSWGNTAFESVEWIMHASYNPENGMLEYSDGVKQIVTYANDVDDPSIEILYSDGKGALRIERGFILWSDENDPEAADGRVFLRGETEPPAELRFIGYYESANDGSTLETILGFDGVWRVTVSIFRLCELEGTAVYDAGKNALAVSAADSSGNPIGLEITEDGNGRKIVTVTDSSWELLPNGEKYMFE